MIPALLSLGVIAAALLIGFGGYAAVRNRDRKRGLLMIAAGLVTLVNIWLWAAPAP